MRVPPPPLVPWGRQAWLAASQKSPAGQSASAAQALAQAPAEQIELRHWVGLAQGAASGLPQRPSAAQTPAAHWAPLVQRVPAGSRGAQVPALQ